jgi:hypothetical protein
MELVIRRELPQNVVYKPSYDDIIVVVNNSLICDYSCCIFLDIVYHANSINITLVSVVKIKVSANCSRDSFGMISSRSVTYSVSECTGNK